MVKNFLVSNRERQYFDSGCDLVVGIDEVGRGAWAGPLYLCAYVMFANTKVIEGVNDSKLLSFRQREQVYSSLYADNYFINITDNIEIDRMGLANAIHKSLYELVTQVSEKFSKKKMVFLIDGYFKGEWPENIHFEIKADRNIYCVACASNIAKVLRDRFMIKQALNFPQYGFEKHVGYGTKAHIEAINKHGICSIHRKSYKPIGRFNKISGI